MDRPNGPSESRDGAARERLRELWTRACGSLPLQAAAVLGLYVPIWWELRRSTVMVPEAYAAPILMGRIPDHPRLSLVIVGLLLPLVLGWRRLRWSQIDEGRRTRLFVFVIALVLGWAFSTHDYNLFFDQAHTIDRLALIALTALVWVHPGFAVAQVILLLVILGQLMYPLPDAVWHWPDKRLPVDCLILVGPFLLVRLALRARGRVYLFGVLCLVAATYGHAAIQKLRLGPYPWSWVLENDLNNIFVAAHATGGWLRGVSDETIVAIADVIGSLRVPLAFGTIVIELAPFALLLHPRATRWIPLALIVMHVAIYATTGIFFWKWIVLHATLVWYASRMFGDHRPKFAEEPNAVDDDDEPLGAPDDSRQVSSRSTWSGGIYGWPMVALLMAFAIGSRWLVVNVSFAWRDTRVANAFVLRGIGESGKVYPIDARFFGPYDLTLHQSRYYYALEAPVLVDTYGTTTNWELAQKLDLASVDDLPALRAEHGVVHIDPRRAGALAMFIHFSLVNAMRRGHRDYWLHHLAPPYHFQTTVPEGAYALDEPLVGVTLTFEEWFYDGHQLIKTREERAGAIPLQRPSGGS